MVSSMRRWSGKVAVVTGASAGIGAAIVDKLVENGIQVVGIARRINLVEEKAKSYSGKIGKLYPIKADITKEEEVEKAFKWIEENLGAVHILINNAGVLKLANLSDASTYILESVLYLNVLALSVVTQHAIKSMKKHNVDGHIVHINSLAGHGIPNFPLLNIYPASKHAVTALTETLRQELSREGSKIKVTSVSPGGTVSEMTTHRKDFPPELEPVMKAIPLLEPEDVAECVVFALSTPKHVQIHELTVMVTGR